MLFYLHLRGDLGLAGKAFMWLMVAYYVLLGVSTGLVNQGLNAIFALFIAWVATAPKPTWRGAIYGVITAAVLVFVLLPIREDLRRLIWTHGVDADNYTRISSNEFSPSAVPDGLVVEESDYDIFLTDGVLTYSHKDPAICTTERTVGFAVMHFLHIFPVNAEDLPAHRAKYRYDNLDFTVSEGEAVVDGRCVHQVRLPNYDIATIRTGLYTRVVPWYFLPEEGEILGELRAGLTTFVQGFLPRRGRPWRVPTGHARCHYVGGRPVDGDREAPAGHRRDGCIVSRCAGKRAAWGHDSG